MTLYTDALVAVLPASHALVSQAAFPENAVNGAPFLLLADEDGRSVVADWIKARRLTPDIRFSSWEDASVLAMAEEGFGIGVVLQTMQRRTDWKEAVRPLDLPVRRRVAIVSRSRERLSEAAERFLAAAERTGEMGET